MVTKCFFRISRKSSHHKKQVYQKKSGIEEEVFESAVFSVLLRLIATVYLAEKKKSIVLHSFSLLQNYDYKIKYIKKSYICDVPSKIVQIPRWKQKKQSSIANGHYYALHLNVFQ